jgi:hypothetical protein
MGSYCYHGDVRSNSLSLIEMFRLPTRQSSPTHVASSPRRPRLAPLHNRRSGRRRHSPTGKEALRRFNEQYP